MVREGTGAHKDRRSDDPKSSVRQPPKKAGGGGKYSVGRSDDQKGSTFTDRGDPNFDPDEKRIDPDDGLAYTFDQLAAFYKSKFNKEAVREYWEYECSAVKSKKTAKAKAGLSGPTVGESAQLAWKEKEKLEKFYDTQGLLKHPKLLNALCAVMAKRYRKMGVTKICAFEARGFLFTPVSIKLGVPFIMLRKDGKMPNTISSAPYTKGYEGVDSMCIQKGAVVEGDKVVLIDDFIATGGTLCAGIELMKACKAEVVECSCMVELKALNGADRCLKAGAKAVWGFISEDLLTKKAELPDDYVDDGKK